MNFDQIKSIHFVGIGGSGMSGIAEVLSGGALAVSGCDLRASAATDRLGRLGVRVLIGHDASHLDGVDLLVTSSAVRRDNPEVLRAQSDNVRMLRRAEMLGTMMQQQRGIAVAGTHGKTTTTAMIATILTDAGLDPTVIVGGVLRNTGTNAQRGRGEFLIAEADEFDRSFLALQPDLAVITNIEADHLDCYRDLDDIRDAFSEFASKISPDGVLVACADDAVVRSVLDTLDRPVVRYGTSENAALRATNLRFSESGSLFDVTSAGEDIGQIELRVPGEHNVRNALAAIGIAMQAGLNFDVIARALRGFGGVERRFQILGSFRGAVVVDDYAHHPTEIRATLDAARRGYPERRIVALFQPHLFSRTRDFSEEFAESLAGADVAFVLPIYPAREEPIEGISSSLLVDAARRHGATVTLVDRDSIGAADLIRTILGPSDLFVTMGAGDVNRVAELILEGVAA